MVLRTCSRCGKGDQTSPCTACKRVINAERERVRSQVRGTTTQRGLGHQHRVLGSEQLRLEPSCRFCGTTENLQRDHVQPRSKGGRSERGNYATACGPCNESRGAGNRPRSRRHIVRGQR